MTADVIVIGGGMAGMVAAIRASEKGKKVLLLERLNMLGKKVSVTGNGRCNLLNTGNPVYFGDASFAREVIRNFDSVEQTAFWLNHGLRLREESDHRVYPMSGLASTVMDVLRTALKKKQVQIFLSHPVEHIVRMENSYKILSKNGETYDAEKVILACGGAASPKHGGTDAGYFLAKQLGLMLEPIRPALVSMIADPKTIHGLSGIRVRGHVAMTDSNHRILCEKDGEILFTEDGVSGICVMQCARFFQEGASLQLNMFSNHETENGLHIGFMPPISIQELRERKSQFACEDIPGILTGIFHPKLSFAICKQAGIELRNRLVQDLESDEIDRICKVSSCFEIPLKGIHGMEQAQVTAGGIRCSDLDSHTMGCRTVPGLYVAGEMLDVDGDCGGYNLMFAVASGYLAGSSASL